MSSMSGDSALCVLSLLFAGFVKDTCSDETFSIRKVHEKGPFTHVISDAISRTKRALPYPARIFFREASRGLERKL